MHERLPHAGVWLQLRAAGAGGAAGRGAAQGGGRWQLKTALRPVRRGGMACVQWERASGCAGIAPGMAAGEGCQGVAGKK